MLPAFFAGFSVYIWYRYKTILEGNGNLRNTITWRNVSRLSKQQLKLSFFLNSKPFKEDTLYSPCNGPV